MRFLHWTHRVRMACAIGAAWVALCLAGCAESNPEAEQAAAAATTAWLAELDAGNYERCWRDAAALFRESESLESWRQKAAALRDPLGAFRQRTPNATFYYTDPPLGPPGQYTMVVYDSVWDAGAIHEILHMQQQQDGSWQVAGYDVEQQ